MSGHLSHQRIVWATIDKLLLSKSEIQLDGSSLTMAQTVAVSRNGLCVTLSKADEVCEAMNNSVAVMNSSMENGKIIYGKQACFLYAKAVLIGTSWAGVNTAPGGNADRQTNKYSNLQHSFFQHQQCGILPEAINHRNKDFSEAMSLSPDMVRAAAVVRCNSFVSGHSAIRQEVVQSLADIISKGMTPLIPSRGSISASGDLCPLSYLGGMIEGNQDIFVRTEKGDLMPSDHALRSIGTLPFILKPKERLAIMNGTSVSTGFAALVLHDCHDLAIICQLLTAMATEALRGRLSNFHPFISKVRPHPGQIEVAQNLRSFLMGTQLCQTGDVEFEELAQDRYAVRTAPQWIGPQLEDLMSANIQISTELNATTDNPLIDVDGEAFHHGGNFQASSVTSAMEKSRTAITMMGRILLGQCGELVNPDTNKGLPPNLCADNPSTSFTCKGVDVNMTSYFSELAFLANSVASHVQTAELHNQSVNSLALISARMTGQAAKLLTMMCAAQLYTVCQALDLRVRDREFLEEVSRLIRPWFLETFQAKSDSPEFFSGFISTIRTSWEKHNRLDGEARCETVAADSIVFILNELCNDSQITVNEIHGWRTGLASRLSSIFNTTKNQFASKQSTPMYLGNSTKRVYEFIRQELRIPYHKGLIDHAPLAIGEGQGHVNRTIGTYITKIFLSIEDKSFLRYIACLL